MKLAKHLAAAAGLALMIGLSACGEDSPTSDPGSHSSATPSDPDDVELQAVNKQMCAALDGFGKDIAALAFPNGYDPTDTRTEQEQQGANPQNTHEAALAVTNSFEASMDTWRTNYVAAGGDKEKSWLRAGTLDLVNAIWEMLGGDFPRENNTPGEGYVPTLDPMWPALTTAGNACTSHGYPTPSIPDYSEAG